MDAFEIDGGHTIQGEVAASVSKNSTLPIMAASLLFSDAIALESLPELRDVNTMLGLLEEMGVQVSKSQNQTILSAQNITQTLAPYDRVRTMRASILVLGPLLARFGEAKVSLPGGCAIGARPIDIHLEGLRKMGAEISIDEGYVVAKAKQLRSADLLLPFPSVGATENLMMAACFADGPVRISNAAREPEISDLANFLTQAGVEISGAGSSEILIRPVNVAPLGKRGLAGPSSPYRPIGDRIEAATFLVAAALCRSSIVVRNVEAQLLEAFLSSLESVGLKVQRQKGAIGVHYQGPYRKTKIDTAAFPGFPTDAQAQMMVLLTQAEGTSILTENIFENRFMHVPELNRMGANIELKGKSALVSGPSMLKGAPVMCTDLRASAALVLASLIAKGTTRVRRVYHIDRGYEKIEQKLQSLGARIRRISE